MAFAMVYPEPASKSESGKKGGRGIKAVSSGNSLFRAGVSKARTVLRYSRQLAEAVVLPWPGLRRLCWASAYPLAQLCFSSWQLLLLFPE
jgi:hypothetical protein